MSVFFNGRLLTTPTVETAVYDDGLAPQGIAVGNTLALIGPADAGIPKKPIRIRSIAHARETLRGGELLYAVEKAFSPSAELAAPGAIYAVRVDPATQSELTLKNSSLDALAIIKSVDYGLHTNSIKLKIEAASGGSGYKATLATDAAPLSVADNLKRDIMTVRYTGSASTATVSITDTELTLNVGSDDPVVISLATLSSASRLAERIRTQPDWTVTLAATAGEFSVLAALDTVTLGNAKAAGGVSITANLQAALDWMNASNTVVASRIVNNGRSGAGTLAPIPFTYLTGADSGVVTNADWSDAFDVLQSEDVQWLAPLSAEPAVWGMADAHCQFMSTVGRRERRCFVGNSSGLTLEQAVADAATINSDRTAYVYPAFYDYNAAGVLTLMPAYQMAAMLAACFASLTPGEPMTNKALRIRGLELPIAVPGDTDYLIGGGVLTVHQAVRGGYRVTKSVSTWLNNGQYNRVEVSTGAALDYVVRTVRERLEVFVGRKGSQVSLTHIVETVAEVLRMLAKAEPFGLGLLAGDESNPPFRNISAELSGDAVHVKFECSPVVPINFVLCSIYAQAYAGTVTA